jgi:2-polyprenyl-3-methyl-5-hydroxy-6-metoxy-1,4-benzoquinol methylase
MAGFVQIIEWKTARMDEIEALVEEMRSQGGPMPSGEPGSVHNAVVSSRDDLEAWDRVAEVYASVIGQETDSIYQRLRPFLDDHLGDMTGLRVLDLGCGHG